VTDPELLNQLNAPAQPKIPPQSLITPEMLQGKAAGPGDTSLADFLVHPIDTLTGKDKVSEQNLSDLVAGQEPAGGSHPFLASAAKGVINFKSMVNDSYISEILPLIEDHKRQYGLNYERATPEQRQDFLNSEAELARHFNKKAEYEKDIQAVTKKYGTDDFSKKADSLYSKPEFQNASTLHQFQMYGDLVLSHPKDIPGHIASVSLESLPTSLTSIVAATMARFMGTGPTGAMMAGGGASGLTEFASEYVDLRQQGDSHEEATMKAGVKSTLIGNMDARSFNSAGKALDRVMGQVDKGIIKRVLSTAKETAKELNKQGMYGAAGEVLGSIASGQKVDPRAALDEYFGELATGPLEALTTYRGKLAEEQAAGAPPAPPGPTPPGAPPPTAGAITDTSEFDEADLPGAKPATPPPPPAEPPPPPESQATKTVTDKVQDMIGKELKQATQDEKGQQILDDLDDKGIAPKTVAEQFWNDTFFKLPAQTQQYFKNYLKKITGMEPGSVLAVDAEGNELIAKDWVDLGKYNAVDLGDRVDYLEGTDRGYVALLDEANRRFENAQVSSPEQAAIPEKSEKAEPEAKKPVYLEKEKDELVKALINSVDSDMGRLLNMKWNDGQIRKDSDLDQFRRVARESLARQEERKKRLEEQGQGNKPIEDKAVEAEALALADELEKYQPGFAAGFRSSIAKGVIQKSEDLDFYRRRTAEYKAQAEGTAAPIKEKQNMETNFYDPNSIEWKNRQKALKSASPELKNMYDNVNTTLQDITDHINQNGWSISDVHQGKAPKNLADLGSLIGVIQSDINQALTANPITITPGTTGYMFLVPYGAAAGGGRLIFQNTYPAGNANDLSFIGTITDEPYNKLTVNGAISSNDVITVLGGNSNQWNSNYTITNTNSANGNVTDLSASIIHIYDNYEEQLLCLHKLLNGVVFDEKKYFIQALKNKLDSYKQQDKKKTYDAYDNFITLENVIEKLVAYNMRCYYCNSKTVILFKNVRTNYQWTLDRLNNYDEHSNANTIICCLKCNLQRRRKNSEKFKFTKQLEHNLLLLKKID
jgi:hypothetical protein